MNDDIGDNQNFDEVIDLAGVENVPTYQRRTKSGEVITVKGYVRTNPDAVADRARRSPGRPSVAAATGRFPGNRSIPLWPDAGRGVVAEVEADTPEYEGMEDTGQVDQASLDREVPVAVEILTNFPQTPSLKKLLSILKGMSSASLSEEESYGPEEEVIELARGIVRVSGYSYVSKKTGRVVRVNPYTQIRSLINAMGGPQMAARKGVTPDLLDKALPGFQIKDKLFKAKAAKSDLRSTGRKFSTKKDRENLAKINQLPIDRVIDIPEPKPGDNALDKAMRATHPLETVRSSPEGSTVIRGNESWTRGLDGLWYKMPRRNNRGVTDKELTGKLINKAGQVQLTQGDPIPRKSFPLSNVNYDAINPRSANYAEEVRYTKALEPVFDHLPEGIADSLTGNVEVRKLASPGERGFSGMTRTTATRANNHYPKLVVHSNPELEADLMKSLPKQQQQGFNVPSTLHPLETMMARESGVFSEKLMQNRAPAAMVDRMYDKFNAAYDKHITKDDGQFDGLSGREGWVARMSGPRSDELNSQIREQLSFSGSRSAEDFVAEAWTEFLANASPRPLSRDLGKAFQDSLEEFSDYMFKRKWADATEIPDTAYKTSVKPSISRKVSDAIGGDTDNLIETNLAPRQLRDVVKSSSKYFDVRDADGSASFDAHVQVEGNAAYMQTLSFPRTSPDDMLDGVPLINPDDTVVQKGARYYGTPAEDLAKGPQLRENYSRYIDQSRALAAIEATEESLSSEGVTDFYVDPRSGDDSVVYARAGYLFDPEATDVSEISSMLEDLSAMLGDPTLDAQEGYFPIDQKDLRSMRTRLSKWQSDLSSDPATWPTPQQIADFGKIQETEFSLGEEVLDRYSWSGVKKITPLSTSAPSVSPSPHKSVSPSDIGSAVRAIRRKQSSRNIDDLKPLMDSILNRHRETYPEATTEVTGSASAHSLRVVDKDGSEILNIDVQRDGDVISWSNLRAGGNVEDARMFFDMQDYWDTVYQKARIKEVRQTTEPDSVGGYSLAVQGFDWVEAPDKETFLSNMDSAVSRQILDMREAVMEAVTARHMDNQASMETLYREQSKVDGIINGLEESIRKQVNSLAEKYDSDPKGPTPLEIAMLGRQEAYIVNNLRRSSPRVAPLPSPPPPTPGSTPEKLDLEDRILQEQIRRQGSMIQQMTNFDGDPLHDNFIEFAGKQFLTLGGYEMMKTMSGYWDWATDTYNPSARKASVGLLFMLLRLLPASVWRGGLLMTANTITRKIKSSRPEDWPEQAEIDDLLNQVKGRLPEGVLDDLKSKGVI